MKKPKNTPVQVGLSPAEIKWIDDQCVASGMDASRAQIVKRCVKRAMEGGK